MTDVEVGKEEAAGLDARQVWPPGGVNPVGAAVPPASEREGKSVSRQLSAG